MAKNYSKMAYADLQKEAKALDLLATGTKDELLARLEGATPSKKEEEVEEAEDSEDGVEAVEEQEAPEEPAAPAAPAAKVPDREVEKQWKGDAMKMKEHLAKQKKVSVMIPLEVGVAPEVAMKVPFIVNMNGYRFSIPRGTFIEVPEQVAVMVKERLESEGKIGADMRIDNDAKKVEALG